MIWPGDEGRGPLSSQGGLAGWQAKRVAAFVEANLAQSIHVDNLASLVQLSASHFSRSFKNSFGATPRSYIIRQRIRHAQTLLLHSREPLAEIALDCGMADQSHLSRVFRRVVGVTPAAWRRRSANAARLGVDRG